MEWKIELKKLFKMQHRKTYKIWRTEIRDIEDGAGESLINFLLGFQIYKGKSRAETISEKIMAENFKPDNKKKCLPRRVTVKIQNIRMEETILKMVRRKTELTSEE